MIIPGGDGWAFQQDFSVIRYLHFNTFNNPTHRAYRKRFACMIARHCGQTLGKAIAYDHIQPDGMHEFFDFGRHGSTGGREYIGLFESELFTDNAQNRPVQHLILKHQRQRRTLSFTQIVYIMPLSNGQSMVEKFLLNAAGTVHSVFYSNINLLPEARYTRHTCRVCFPHRLLYLLWIGIHDELCTL